MKWSHWMISVGALPLSQSFTSRTVRHFQTVFIFQSRWKYHRLDNLNNGDVASQCGGWRPQMKMLVGMGPFPGLWGSPLSEGALGRDLRASPLASGVLLMISGVPRLVTSITLISAFIFPSPCEHVWVNISPFYKGIAMSDVGPFYFSMTSS